MPSSIKDKPDASLLSLQVMNVDVLIDNQHASVRVLQIFDNHTAQALEGKYLFALPPQCIRLRLRRLGRRHAHPRRDDGEAPRQQHLRRDQAAADRSRPLATGRRARRPRRPSPPKSFPSPPTARSASRWNTRRCLPVEGLSSHFTFPLKPSFGERATRRASSICTCASRATTRSRPSTTRPSAYPLAVLAHNRAQRVRGRIQARDIELKADFSFDYTSTRPPAHSPSSPIARPNDLRLRPARPRACRAQPRRLLRSARHLQRATRVVRSAS